MRLAVFLNDSNCLTDACCSFTPPVQKKHACGFKCPTFSACKHLWKCAVEQQYFFT